MNLHEYQAKQLFAEYGLPVSKGATAETSSEAVAAADIIGGDQWVVKAQVHAGGRGKAGGVKLVSSKAEIEEFAEDLSVDSFLSKPITQSMFFDHIVKQFGGDFEIEDHKNDITENFENFLSF